MTGCSKKADSTFKTCSKSKPEKDEFAEGCEKSSETIRTRRFYGKPGPSKGSLEPGRLITRSIPEPWAIVALLLLLIVGSLPVHVILKSKKKLA